MSIYLCCEALCALIVRWVILPILHRIKFDLNCAAVLESPEWGRPLEARHPWLVTKLRAHGVTCIQIQVFPDTPALPINPGLILGRLPSTVSSWTSERLHDAQLCCVDQRIPSNSLILDNARSLNAGRARRQGAGPSIVVPAPLTPGHGEVCHEAKRIRCWTSRSQSSDLRGMADCLVLRSATRIERKGPPNVRFLPALVCEAA